MKRKNLKPLNKTIRKNGSTNINKLGQKMTNLKLSRNRNKMVKNSRRILRQTHYDFGRAYINFRQSYARALVCPEHAENAKIPSIFPLPTVSCRKKLTIPFTASVAGVPALSTNSGKFCLAWNPFYVNDTSTAFTELFINNSGLLNLNTVENVTGFTATPLNFGVSPGIFNEYRLVSASMSIVPQVAMTSGQGLICGGAYVTPQQANAVANNTQTFIMPEITISSNIDNAMYFSRANVTSLQGLRMVYFPVDPTYESFVPFGNTHGSAGGTHTDFFFVAYGTGLPSGANLTLELTVNYEAIPVLTNQSFLTPITYQGKEDTSAVIKQISSMPELLSQANSDISGMVNATETAEEKIQVEHKGYASSVFDFISSHSGDILNVAGKLSTFL
jgi:hypothetical protein